MGRHSYSGNAVATALSAGIDSSDSPFSVGAIVNFPDTAVGTFFITVDKGLSTEEKIEIASYAGTTLTPASGGRGADGTTPQDHSMGASVAHTLDAGTINQANEVVNGVGTSTPSTSAVGDAASDGTAVTTPAAGDHKHARESFATGATTASAPADTENDGSSISPARADHKHARESYATIAAGVASLIPIALTSHAASLGTDYTVGGSLATFLTTASLATGTWLVTLNGTLGGTAGAGTCEIEAVNGTITATLAGKTSAAPTASGSLSTPESFSLSFIATVTGPGSVVFQAKGTNSPVIKSTTPGNSYANATGYTAVKIA